MPISIDDLKTNIKSATLATQIGAVLKQLTPDRDQRLEWFVIIALDDGTYLAPSWGEIEQALFDQAATPQNRLNLTFADLRSWLPEPCHAVESANTSTTEARRMARRYSAQRMVVLQNGVPIGILPLGELAAPGTDPLDGIQWSYQQPTNVIGDSDNNRGDEPDNSAILSPNEPETNPPAKDVSPPAKDTRYFNAWVDGHDIKTPLNVGESYELCFNVDAPRQDSIASAAVDEQKLFDQVPVDAPDVLVTVTLISDDFEIINDQQTLKVPRKGKSKNTVRFAIEPKKNGPAAITALFIANNRIFQKMNLTLQVGQMEAEQAWAGTTRGGTMMAIRPPTLPNQTVNLVIEKSESGYKVQLIGGARGRALLKVSTEKITELIYKAREELKGLVYFRSADNRFVYQAVDTTIPAEVHTETLKKLARLGFLLYQSIFFAPGNGPDAQNLGKLLRQLSQQNQLQISVVAESFIFPWALLYDQDRVDPNNIKAEHFWGFKHIIEYMPEFSSPTVTTFLPEIKVKGDLNLGFVCNKGIDEELGRKGLQPVVQPQISFLQGLSGVKMTEYPTSDTLLDLLSNPDSPEQMLYFYCHAESFQPGERDKAGTLKTTAESRFLLTNGSISLDDLNFGAPTNLDPLKNAPLVFVNACQSAELSPLLYDGLIPYLIARGARGVIGTEVDTPALFAAEFAKTFLQRFTGGNQPLGQLLLDMRLEYLHQKNNVMGLVYALYSSGNVVVERSA